LGFTVGRWGSTGVRGITDPNLARRHGSELADEGLVQQGLLQFLQGGEFAFVEAREALGFAEYEIQACLVSA
jgi:hypothetical protein